MLSNCNKATIFLLIATLSQLSTADYQPNWESLDSRPLPAWYDESKFGIFMVMGVYSVPGIVSEWFWERWEAKWPEPVAYMEANYKPNFTYQEFAPMLTAELFDADYWAQLVKDSGAKYYVFTTKHCEGYTMWPSNFSWNWNAKDVGPNKDIVGELAAAFQKMAPEIKFGLYYSLDEWFNPLFMEDAASNYTKTGYRDTVSLPQLHEIITQYQPDILWSDADPGPDTYWMSKEFLAWLYNDSPVKDTVVTNDRWGDGAMCHHGGYYTCDDEYNPGTLQGHKWENAMKVDTVSWGFRRTATMKDIRSIETLLQSFAETISCGGNLLLNVGPTHDGRIIPIFEERLLQMGQWLGVNGEAVYSSKPWIYQNDTINPDVWYTSKMTGQSKNLPSNRLYNPQISDSTVVYAFILKWPQNGTLNLGAPILTEDTKLSLLGYDGTFSSKFTHLIPTKLGGIQLDLATVQWWKLPNNWAWVLKMEHLASDDRVPHISLPETPVKKNIYY